jgi:phosphate acyltransferase
VTVTVAVDANGADLGPAEELGDVPDGVEIVDAPVSIAKAPDPVLAVRSTPESSIVQAARAVSEGRAQALVAGGSTGAALAAGLFNIKRASGIFRPALAIPIPVPGKPVTLVDVGANAESRPEHLVQFAFMGAALATVVLGIDQPRVALLSNGEEAMKGTALVQETHEKLAGSPLRFVGNVEGLDLTSGVADVIVTDGFTGNVALKVAEGVSQTMLEAVRAAAMSSARAKLGGALLRPSLRGLRDQLDPEGPGGAYLLGLRSLGVVPHGRFSRFGWSQAILLAARGVSGDVVGRTHAALEAAGALRAKASASVATVPGQP